MKTEDNPLKTFMLFTFLWIKKPRGKIMYQIFFV